MAKNTGNGNTGTRETPRPPKAKPRDYIVCAETTAGELRNGVHHDDASMPIPDGTRVLVVLGPATASTPKAARIEVAKTKVPDALLTRDEGFDLNAVAAKALTSGRKPVKLDNKPVWDA